MGELPVCFLCGEKDGYHKILSFYVCDDCLWEKAMIEREPDKWHVDNCRFCGSDDIVLGWGSDGIDDVCCVRCLSCNATGPTKHMEVDSIEAWNKKTVASNIVELEFISVRDRLPTETTYDVIFLTEKDIHMGTCFVDPIDGDASWHECDWAITGVTHWTVFPKIDVKERTK